MDPHSDRSSQRPTELDDDQLGGLVRATADDWRLPPQRLDRPTWRDRVGSRPRRRQRGWLPRLAAPATAAIVGTVVVAFIAVWLTAPRSDRAIVGKSPSVSSASPSPGSTRPTASTLPVLFRDGDLPEPAQVMVRSDGAYQIADLATGRLGASAIGWPTGPTTLLARPGGGWVCICSDWTGSGGDRTTSVEVTIETIDASGEHGSRTVIRTLRGSPDADASAAGQPEPVDVQAVGSPDGRFAFVGWSARDAATGWTAGIDLIDVAAASVVSSVSLPVTKPAGLERGAFTRTAPRVGLSPSGDTILVSSFWFVDDPSPTPPSGADHWTASFDGHEIGSMKPAGATPGERCGEVDSGLIDRTSYYVLCWTPSGRLMVERDGLDGKNLGRTEVPRMDSALEGGSLVTRQGDLLYLWDPVMSRLARFNLRSAEVETTTATAAAPSTGALDAVAALGRQLGRWLAPTALAKTFLDPALVVSADGTRIYALGIDPLSGNETGRSRGVYVFDATSLTSIGHWAPTADFISIATSPDGRFVYAAGQAGRDAAGNESGDRASITVYDTMDGAVRLIAGQLGSGMLIFPGTTVR